jgi:hypothetical protein
LSGRQPTDIDQEPVMMTHPEITSMVVAQHHKELQRHADQARLAKSARTPHHRLAQQSAPTAQAPRGFRTRIRRAIHVPPAQPAI